MVINMAGRQQRDRRRVQGQHVYLRPQVSGGGGSGQRQRASVGRGRQSSSLQDGRSTSGVPQPPCPAPHLQPWQSSPPLSVTSPSDPQFRCFCVLMNNLRRISQHGLGVDCLLAHVGCCQRLLAHVGNAKTRGEQCFHLPTGKFKVSAWHHAALWRWCRRQTEGEQNLCVVTLTSAANTCAIVRYSSTVFGCSSTCNQN